ncbi:hypothetical protein H8S95_12770 [Pontibacter sp. KCTC 32443]|uniref:hypothetical protein n=1 Tax=Pontibacter TaxID=323449 RepID=UPI00164CE17A|nr:MULTISPECIES: hypothetical protein [Pontibacter]MBC5774942.1 hypothetical protein [Pontibacter sp. KCTC 32443]
MNSTYSILKESDSLSRSVSPASFNGGLSSDDLMEYATIDGGVVDYYACEQAVSNGAGIFIGGYFVGVTEFSHCYSQQTFLRL